MKVIETVGKDIEEALKKGLAELDCRLDDVEVKILEHPGIFSKARVQFTYQDKDGRAAIKTKADIMRNLEQRAAQGTADSRRNGRENKRQENDRRKSEQRAVNEQRSVPVVKSEQKSESQVKPTVAKNEQKQERADNAPVKEEYKNRANVERKNEFRKDFRSELAAAQNEKKSVQSGKQQNERLSAQNAGQHFEKRNAAKSDAPGAEELTAASSRAKAYLEKLLQLMNVSSEQEFSVMGGEINADIKTEDAIVIGHRGETLDALEYLTTLAAAGEDKYIHVNLDCGGYRAKRNEQLIETATAAAEKAVATGKRVELEPMGSASRRTVHAVLSGRSDVTTKSEGKEPNRYIVIVPRTAGGAQPVRNRNNNRRRHKNNRAQGGNRERRNDKSE